MKFAWIGSLPPGIGPSIRAVEITFPSRTYATVSSTTSFWSPPWAALAYALYKFEVRALRATVPARLRVSMTAHWLLVVDCPAVASLICMPRTVVAPRTYLPPLLSHETTCAAGLSKLPPI